MKSVAGGCHCGAVRFTAMADVSKAVACNCTICEKKGSLLSFVPSADFDLLASESALTDYLFNTETIIHRFCSACSVQSFAQSADGVMINLRCIDGIDLGAVERAAFDGRSM